MEKRILESCCKKNFTTAGEFKNWRDQNPTIINVKLSKGGGVFYDKLGSKLGTQNPDRLGLIFGIEAQFY